MTLLRNIAGGIRSLFQKQHAERELDEELRGFMEMAAEESMKQGRSEKDALRAVRLERGSVEAAKEHVRSAGWESILETSWRDLCYGLRVLRKSPGFTIVAVLTLALGIGANTALFSVVNGVLLNPLPYPDPNELVELAEHSPQFGEFPISYPNFLDWVRENHAFQSLSAYRQNTFSLTGVGQPQRVKAAQVSASFFPLLGVKPVIGRNFTAVEDTRGAAPTVMLSESLWKTRFGGSPDILGKTITLDGVANTVVGVVPANFYFCCQSTNFHLGDVYTPIGAWAQADFYRRNYREGLFAVGRLRPGVTLAQAQADMDSIGHALSIAYPDADSRSGIWLAPLKSRWVVGIKPMLLMLLAAVGFVLLIACVNVANLLLARSTARTREFAIRAALGASHGRVVRQLLTESTLLSVVGGVLGLLLASWGTTAALRALPQALPRANDVGIDARVLLFTLAICILVGLLFGLAPALKTSKPDLRETLKEGGRGASGGHYRTQGVFVVSEIALAVVLLISAGLAIRSLARLWDVNPGFNSHDVLGFGVSLPASFAKQTPDEFRASLMRLRNTIATVPGVEAVSSEDGAVPFGGDSEIPFWIEGRAKPATQAQMALALLYLVTPGYLKVMQIPLLQGRFFTEQDNGRTPHVGVIDENFAKKYFKDENPIGKRIQFPEGKPIEVVGVVGHVMQWSLASPGLVQIALYIPVVQQSDSDIFENTAGFMVRTQTLKYANAEAIERAIEKANGEEIPSNFESMDAAISDSLTSRRFTMILLDVFAALALLLAAVGIYGVFAYSVEQRTHEIGIRITLGAQRRVILEMVLGQGAKLMLIGVTVGVAAAFGLTRFLSSQLYGVAATDPLTFSGVAILLALIALLACYIPARRATRVDPMVALRYE
ncbi:MAG TPA: ABC transporter permease [Candidatus Acidoferrales bacterium]|nr:ABC transporter permease [Candidatus Acidoferrales bacterium]